MRNLLRPRFVKACRAARMGMQASSRSTMASVWSERFRQVQREESRMRFTFRNDKQLARLSVVALSRLAPQWPKYAQKQIKRSI